MIQFKTTKKLFFNKYVNSLEISHIGAQFLRSRDFNGFKCHSLMQLSSVFPRIADCEEKKQLLDTVVSLFQEYEGQYKLCTEWTHIRIYTNNDAFLEKVSNIYKCATWFVQITRPKNDHIKQYLLSSTNCIVTKEKVFDYKVWIRPFSEFSEFVAFEQWASTIPKIKFCVKRWNQRGYFYASGDNTITMCKFFLCDKIVKIDKFIAEHELD